MRNPLAPDLAPFWQIWANPLVKRYRHARLRPLSMLFWCLLTLLITGATVAIMYAALTERGGVEPAAVARWTLVPVLIIQGFILMLMGTGTVASGVVQDRLDGVFAYQRLLPMSPTTKIVGYLFGLPIREYLMFALTLPFALFAIIFGRIPIGTALLIYFVFMIAVVLYHLTGFTAAMVATRWRLAARLAQGLVILLYLVLPQLSALGLYFFEYVTVRPVVTEQLFPLLPDPDTLGTTTLEAPDKSVPFFTGALSGASYSLLVQGLLMGVFFVMIYRKWTRPDRPALSKPFALGVVVGFGVLMLANLWPVLTGTEHVQAILPFDLTPLEATLLGVPALFAFFFFLLLTLLILIVASPPVRYQLGVHRARRFGQSHLHPARDEASLLPALGVALLLVALFTLTAVAVIDRFLGYPPDLSGWMTGLLLLLVVAQVTLLATLVVENFGHRAFLFLFLIAWLAPLLVGAFLIARGDAFVEAALFVLTLSPVPQLTFAVALIPPEIDLPFSHGTLLAAFVTGQIAMLAASVVLTMRLVRQRQRAWASPGPAPTPATSVDAPLPAE